MPRNAPRRDREWFNWTNWSRSPTALSRSWSRNASRKKPRSSPNVRNSWTQTPVSRPGRTSVSKDERGAPQENAIRREREQGIHLLLFEVAHEEHRAQIRQHARHQAADERWHQRCPRFRAQQRGHFEHPGSQNNRGREQEGKPRRRLVLEPDQEPADHGRARAREARQERDHLAGANGHRL